MGKRAQSCARTPTPNRITITNVLRIFTISSALQYLLGWHGMQVKSGRNSELRSVFFCTIFGFAFKSNSKISVVSHRMSGRGSSSTEKRKRKYNLFRRFCQNLLYSDNLFCVWSLPRPDSLFTIAFFSLSAVALKVDGFFFLHLCRFVLAFVFTMCIVL